MDAAQIGIAQRAVVHGAASQIDDVGPARLQLHRKPVAVAVAPDVARGRVADRHPPARGGARREVLAGRLGYRLRRTLIRLRNRWIDLHRLIHVGDVDCHGGVGRLIPVARPDSQLEAGGTGLVVLAPARVEQLAAGRVDLEQPCRVAALDAVGQRVAVRVRRRDRAQRYPVRAAVRVLREVETVELRAECRWPLLNLLLRRCPLCLQPRHFGRVRVAHPVAEHIRIRTRLLRLHPYVIRPRQQRLAHPLVRRAGTLAAVQHVALCVLQHQVRIGVLAPKPKRHRARLAQREPVPRHRIGAAVERAQREPRRRQLRDVPEILGRRPRRLRLLRCHRFRRRLDRWRVLHRPRRHVRHPQRVAPGLVAVPRRSHVVRPARRWRERHPAVAAAAEVVVVAARLVAPLAVVDGSQESVAERPAAARAASEVELVGPPGLQLHREPVLVMGRLNGPGGRAAHGDGARGLYVG